MNISVVLKRLNKDFQAKKFDDMLTDEKNCDKDMIMFLKFGIDLK